EATRLAREIGDEQTLAEALYPLAAVVDQTGGDKNWARELMGEGRRLCEELGDQVGARMYRRALSIYAWDERDFATASRLLEENCATPAGEKSDYENAYELRQLGMLAHYTGHAARATALLEQALDHARALD